MLDAGNKWKQLSPMPKPDSHIESAWVVLNNSIIIVGGMAEKHPITKRMMLVGEVFQFCLDKMEWSVIGRMPCRVKTALVGFSDGWMYFSSGQRDRGPDNPQPRKIIGNTRGTKLRLWFLFHLLSVVFFLSFNCHWMRSANNHPCLSVKMHEDLHWAYYFPFSFFGHPLVSESGLVINCHFFFLFVNFMCCLFIYS